MKTYLPDLMLISGAVSISFGAWLAWPPAGYLVAGVLLIFAGLEVARALSGDRR